MCAIVSHYGSFLRHYATLHFPRLSRCGVAISAINIPSIALHCKALAHSSALNHVIDMQGNGTRPPGHLAYVSRQKKPWPVRARVIVGHWFAYSIAGMHPVWIASWQNHSACFFAVALSIQGQDQSPGENLCPVSVTIKTGWKYPSLVFRVVALTFIVFIFLNLLFCYLFSSLIMADLGLPIMQYLCSGAYSGLAEKNLIDGKSFKRSSFLSLVRLSVP